MNPIIQSEESYTFDHFVMPRPRYHTDGKPHSIENGIRHQGGYQWHSKAAESLNQGGK